MVEVQADNYNWTMVCFEGDDFQKNCPIVCKNYGGWDYGGDYPNYSHCNGQGMCWCRCGEGQPFINGECGCADGQLLCSQEGSHQCYDPKTAVCNNGIVTSCTKGSIPCTNQCIDQEFMTCTNGVVECIKGKPCGQPGNIQCYNPNTRVCLNNQIQTCTGKWGANIYNGVCNQWGCETDGDCEGSPHGSYCCYTPETGAHCSMIASCTRPSQQGAQTPFQALPPQNLPGKKSSIPAAREEYERQVIPGQREAPTPNSYFLEEEQARKQQLLQQQREQMFQKQQGAEQQRLMEERMRRP